MKSQVDQNFSDFYEKWMSQLEKLLQLLISSSKDDKNTSQSSIIDNLTSHHKQYYTFKWAAAKDDVLAVFAPVWLTPLENAHNWITGWKPSMVFCLVDSLRSAQLPVGVSLTGLSPEQATKIEALRHKIKLEEEKVEREMERQQVAMADRKIVELAGLERRAKGDVVVSERVNGLVEVAMKVVLSGLERVMKMADCVRLKTLKEVLEVLTPAQCVDFLAAKAILMIQMRKWGKMKEKGGHEMKSVVMCDNIMCS